MTRLLVAAGAACADYHDRHVRGVTAPRVQADEVWSFTYCKQKHVGDAVAAPPEAGDVWTWTALAAESKLMLGWLVGDRDADTACYFLTDVQRRLAHRTQLTTDGHRAYLYGVKAAFGADVDYAQLVKLYGEAPAEVKGRYSPTECVGIRKRPVIGQPDPAAISTSYVEWQNLNIRMGNRRFTRLTNAFSKKLANHAHMLAVYFTYYNFCRQHQTLGTTPAVAASLAAEPYPVDLAGNAGGGADATADATRPRPPAAPPVSPLMKRRHYRQWQSTSDKQRYPTEWSNEWPPRNPSGYPLAVHAPLGWELWGLTSPPPIPAGHLSDTTCLPRAYQAGERRPPGSPKRTHYHF